MTVEPKRSRLSQDVNTKSTTVVESWEGSKERQVFSHSMTRNASVTYTWAFQRTNHALDVRERAAGKPDALSTKTHELMFAGSPLRRRRGQNLLRKCNQRCRRGGISLSGLRSGASELSAGGLLLRPLPGGLLHRQKHQQMSGVPPKHTLGWPTHLWRGRVHRLWTWKRQQQGRGRCILSFVEVLDDFF